ncbi:DUF4177 domain-containing protein [Flavobacterium oreochromis]|uniref:DUF4177 domain-containing protein n=1 Tax=Flavobacterium oreochromis TaxID=2906078 RepID=UPI000B4CA238|nr:DUF4177 domain-containing protein [Flavobacterium oreochromis]OWP75520.1 hypothetical protein BWG23_10780 [Flavobacterium oreochromis]
MEYKVVPFVASLDPKKGTSGNVANQLENLINDFSSQGWKYVRLESVTTFVNPETGCFGLGAKPGYITTRQMIVFER